MTFKDRCLAHIIYLFYKCYYKTLVIRAENRWWENSELDPARPIVLAHWHEDDMALIGAFAPARFHVIVSLSRDGHLLSYVLAKLGCIPVRGSSSRGGARALLAMIKALKESNGAGAITIDGPRGPRHQAKPGVVTLAQKTNAQLLTVSAGARRRFVFRKSWSQTYLPLPFTTVEHIVSKTPIVLPKDDSQEEFSRVLREIETRLENDHMDILSRHQRG
ncbi:lysophospholipid acyltransferase family protein [bacterium]|nr:lysophospholipid acyltransferase family protein [candidate division CSSED10-310 bacterium]